MKRLIQFCWLWGPVLIWCWLIFHLSSMPLPSVGQTYWQDWWLKNLAHIAEYGILYLLVFRAQNQTSLLMPFIFTFIYAVSDEFHQSFVPGREAWWGDVAFDSFGAVLALLLVRRSVRS